MVTTITSKVGVNKTGGQGPPNYEYTTLAAWELDRRGNIVTRNGGDNDGTIEVAEIYGGGNAGPVTIYTGWLTDATHYIEIRAAAGHKHNGIWDTNKAYMSASTFITMYICMDNATNAKNVHLIGLQIKGTDPIRPGIRHSCNTGPGNLNIDQCIVFGAIEGARITGVGVTQITNSIFVATNLTGQVTGIWTSNDNVNTIYNCTVIAANSSGTKYGLLTAVNSSVVSQNNYIAVGNGAVYANGGSGATFTKGANDATSNTEAITSNLRNIAYSTANFINVTPGSENLRLVVSQANKLIDNGANLTSSGVTTDIIGTARPLFGGFDIGAFENDVPICWNYTARYKSSNKLFKASGCGPFPKMLKVPSNVDISTGKMVDDGVFINPDKYKVI